MTPTLDRPRRRRNRRPGLPDDGPRYFRTAARRHAAGLEPRHKFDLHINFFACCRVDRGRASTTLAPGAARLFRDFTSRFGRQCALTNGGIGRNGNAVRKAGAGRRVTIVIKNAQLARLRIEAVDCIESDFDAERDKGTEASVNPSAESKSSEVDPRTPVHPRPGRSSASKKEKR
jgi:hypothetical protein